MSRKIPALRPKKLLRALLRAGFFVHYQKGSHIQLRNYSNPKLRVTIPFHTRFDLPPSVIKSILNQAEISREEFLNFLSKNK